MRQWTFGLHKIRGILWLAEELSVSQEEHGYMELFTVRYLNHYCTAIRYTGYDIRPTSWRVIPCSRAGCHIPEHSTPHGHENLKSQRISCSATKGWKLLNVESLWELSGIVCRYNGRALAVTNKGNPRETQFRPVAGSGLEPSSTGHCFTRWRVWEECWWGSRNVSTLPTGSFPWPCTVRRKFRSVHTRLPVRMDVVAGNRKLQVDHIKFFFLFFTLHAFVPPLYWTSVCLGWTSVWPALDTPASG